LKTQKDSADTTNKTTQPARCTANSDLTENILCKTILNCSALLSVPVKKWFSPPVLTQNAKKE